MHIIPIGKVRFETTRASHPSGWAWDQLKVLGSDQPVNLVGEERETAVIQKDEIRQFHLPDQRQLHGDTLIGLLRCHPALGEPLELDSTITGKTYREINPFLEVFLK